MTMTERAATEIMNEALTAAVLDAVAAKRQLLVEERQRRAQSLATAAERVLAGIVRRAQSAKNAEELNAYFASDAMVHKLGELSNITVYVPPSSP